MTALVRDHVDPCGQTSQPESGRDQFSGAILALTNSDVSLEKFAIAQAQPI
jgi:hypothetical protein